MPHRVDQAKNRLMLRARYVFPVAGRPISDGFVAVEGEQIAAVGAGHGDGEVVDLGNVAILPGLVNAHAHLDFSDLASPLGKRGCDFVSWIRLAMNHRRETPLDYGQRLTIGLNESVRCGVTTLGDIIQPDWPAASVVGRPPSVVAFQELIAPTTDRVAGALELARSHLRHGVAESVGWQPGLSPHAPYSVCPELLNSVVALSAKSGVPVAMHLAESREELDLLGHGSGPLRMFLEEIGAWDTAAMRCGRRPIEYLRQLALAHRALVIHGNYLDNEEIAFCGANAARMSVVYCPRTHDWFGRDAYPLEKMLASGVAVALGTDGRGSSPDLSLLAEMRFAASRHPAVGRERILQMGTIAGAKALGRESHEGSLEPGKQADLAIVALPNRDAADPHDLLFDSSESVVGTYCRGAEAWRSPDLPNRRPNSSSTSRNGTPQ